ncbi:hypothetical protein H2C43_07210 [Corynebacterium glutamicum]|uniref:hypothetical protein n=1 Tax=Corynebacterium glutamicum TaxID=1718 RepID=UPI000319903D|nr:hypothetical protein [Corynebacterium glutamicum]MBA4571796.1 hypothetical protein [Corynebacterium glutamicum]MBA4574731.1 hypothetical protein [Corynebacterium glutamicum]MBA4577660.1 hypothetical protein [Corynebacterium glutamicum]MBA4579640.1 hypothetical protein [Corynebacterium glutamicum]MBA4583507.1 hypothetical protein [Corynebacterium glutamicum]
MIFAIVIHITDVFGDEHGVIVLIEIRGIIINEADLFGLGATSTIMGVRAFLG